MEVPQEQPKTITAQNAEIAIEVAARSGKLKEVGRLLCAGILGATIVGTCEEFPKVFDNREDGIQVKDSERAGLLVSMDLLATFIAAVCLVESKKNDQRQKEKLRELFKKYPETVMDVAKKLGVEYYVKMIVSGQDEGVDRLSNRPPSQPKNLIRHSPTNS